MLTNAELKAKARESLKGKYGKTIGVNILYFILALLAVVIAEIIFKGFHLSETLIESLMQIVSLTFSGLFTFGYLNFFLKISRNEEAEVSDLWNKTNLFIPYIVASILIFLFTTLWTLLLIIPGIIAAFSYSMTYYVMLDNPNMGAKEAISESKKIMNGHKMDFFVLSLSFIGWAILGVFTLGILYFWLIPYMHVTICNFYNNIRS